MDVEYARSRVTECEVEKRHAIRISSSNSGKDLDEWQRRHNKESHDQERREEKNTHSPCYLIQNP